jgi:PAS domain S-box-containing protein
MRDSQQARKKTVEQAACAEVVPRESEDRFRSAFDDGPFGIVFLGLGAQIQRCNRRFCEMLCYSESEIIAMGLVGITHPQDQELDREFAARLLCGEIPHYTINKRYLRKNGVAFWGQLTVSMVRDVAGKPSGLVGFVEDINERKKAEEALRESEEHYRGLAESTADAIAVHDRDGSLLYGNRAGAVALRLDPSRVVGARLEDINPPEIAQKQKEAIATVFRTGKPLNTSDDVYTFPWGEVWINTQLTPLTNNQGQVISVMSVSHDVTTRKLAEKALEQSRQSLRESERRYRTLAESITDAIGIHDRDGTLLYGNPAGAAYFAINPEEVPGKTQSELFSREAAKQHVDEIAKVFETGETAELDNLYHLATGDFWFNVRMIPLKDEQGRVTSVLTVSRDVTSRKLAEQSLQQAHDTLERCVEERTAELLRANEQLQQDVKERQALEATLRQSRDELQTIYNEMVEGCVIVDIETKRFVRVNASFCHMLGYTEDELLTTSAGCMFPPENVAVALQRFELAASGQSVTGENRPIRRKDGSIFHADATSRRIVYNGRPCVFTLFRDVSERKRAQEALLESEERYKTLVHTLPDAVVLADLNGRALFVSQRHVELHLADSADEFLRKTAFDYLAPEDHEKGRLYYEKTLTEGITRNVEYTFLRKDGSRFPAELSAAVVRDASGNPVAIINVLRDITERKQAEEALRQSHDELSSIYDSVVDGIIVADLEAHKPLRANAACSEMLGYSLDEAARLTPEMLHPPEAMPAVSAHFARVRQGHVSQIVDVPFVRKDGDIVYVDVVTRPIRYNSRSCWISFLHDATERHRAEQALRNKQRTMKHLLQSSDHERQLIAYEIHDGVAQHLAGAIMQFETYFHQKDSASQKALKAFEAGMTMLRQGHGETRRLISGVRPPILDESGIAAAIAHLVSDGGNLKGPRIEYRSAVLFDRLAPLVENALYRIVQEGLANACRHSKSEMVRVSLVQRGDRIRMEIRDWGVGFDVREIREDRFGLEGIRQRVRLLGGRCRIRSKPGNGTRIVAELPVIEKEQT